MTSFNYLFNTNDINSIMICLDEIFLKYPYINEIKKITVEIIVNTYQINIDLFNIMIKKYDQYVSDDHMYNFIYAHSQENINLKTSLKHYNIALKLCSEIQFTLNVYNNIALIYSRIKKHDIAFYYLSLAFKIDNTNPDINYQLGVIYTSKNDFNKALVHLNIAETNYSKSFISVDHLELLRNVYLDKSYLYSRVGNIIKVNEYISKASDISDCIITVRNKAFTNTYKLRTKEDVLETYELHKKINSFYDEIRIYKCGKFNFNTEKINIGFVSDDFINHPVEFFISSFLTSFDNNLFNIICYSSNEINKQIENVTFKNIAELNCNETCNLIYNDNIHILIDLSGQTAGNKLNVFANRPAPIQITYIGYPFTTGLEEMQYRITDKICEFDVEQSQKFYTEKLLMLPDCFTCFDVNVFEKIPNIVERKEDDFINIGCFNRLNKINDRCKQLYQDILLSNPKFKFYFKNKSFQTESERILFLSFFDPIVTDRIVLLCGTKSLNEHMESYNLIDFTIDTFPYSGTTTSCDSLYMGVPVFTIYDTEKCLHISNVTVSLLKNSNMDKYVCTDCNDLISKVNNYIPCSKQSIRGKFVNGKVCDKESYTRKLETLFIDLFNRHKNN